jgi:hypothetical protein
VSRRYIKHERCHKSQAQRVDKIKQKMGGKREERENKRKTTMQMRLLNTTTKKGEAAKGTGAFYF